MAHYIKINLIILMHLFASPVLFAGMSDPDTAKVQWISDFGLLQGTSAHINITEIPLHPHTSLIHTVDSFATPRYCSGLNKRLKLKHTFPYFGLRDRVGANFDTLSFLDTSYCIQALLRDSFVSPGIIAAYQMTIKDKKYLLLIVRDEGTSGWNLFTWDLLFDITDRHMVKWIPLNMDNGMRDHSYSANFLSAPPAYFGDINKDGILDFLFYTKDAILTYTISRDSAVIIPDYYLKTSTQGPPGWCISIDMSRSKWFTPLTFKNTDATKCHFQFLGLGRSPNYIRHSKGLPKRFK